MFDLFTEEEREYVVKANDLHVPFHDLRAYKTFLKFVKYLQPKIIVIDEFIDFHQISRFSKDPKTKCELQRDINTTKDCLDMLRQACPKSVINMVESNHDKRLEKYTFEKAEEISSLDDLRFKNLLKLSYYNINYMPEFTYKDFLFKHGGLVKKSSAESARFEFSKENVSGASGHSHRAGLFFKTQRNGSFCWMETGCLCKTKNVEYIDGTPDWQQAIGIVGFKKKSNHFYPTVLPIINYEIMWGKRSFKA